MCFVCWFPSSCRVPVQMFGSLHVPAFPGWCSRARPSQVSSRGTLWGAWGPCCWTRAWMSERRPLERSGESVRPTGCLPEASWGFGIIPASRCAFGIHNKFLATTFSWQSSHPQQIQDEGQQENTNVHLRVTTFNTWKSSRRSWLDFIHSRHCDKHPGGSDNINEGSASFIVPKCNSADKDSWLLGLIPRIVRYWHVGLDAKRLIVFLQDVTFSCFKCQSK